MIYFAKKYALFFLGLAAGVAVFLGVSWTVQAQLSTSANLIKTGAIERVIPQSGGKGQYITIVGKQMGIVPGDVTFVQGAQSAPADISFPAQCARTWWRDNAVIIKVPATAKQGENKIKIKNSNGDQIGETSFTVTQGSPTPGICGMEPDNGPVGVATIVYGERFGSKQGTVTFGTAAAEVAEGGWNDSAIRLKTVPQFDGTSAIVRVVTTDNTLSSPGIFTSGRCRANNCGDGSNCCGDGSCRPAGACQETRAACTYSWSFYTGRLGAFGVACKNGQECQSGTCQDGKCALGAKKVGEQCSFDAQCAGGLCANGLCAATKKTIGEKCENNDQCLSGRCLANTCVPGTKKFGDACGNNDECSSAVCVPGKCGQPAQCLRIEKSEPQGVDIRQNSVFSVTFNQLVDENSARNFIQLKPSIKGTYEFRMIGQGDTAKSQVVFQPSELLSRQRRYVLDVGNDVRAAHSENTLGRCVNDGKKLCNRPGEICTANGAVCTNGAICTGDNAVCVGAGTRCTGQGSTCAEDADCSQKNRVIEQKCFTTARASDANPLHTTVRGESLFGRVRNSVHEFYISYIVHPITQFIAAFSFSHTFQAFAETKTETADPTLPKPELTVSGDRAGSRAILHWAYDKTIDYDGFEIYRKAGDEEFGFLADVQDENKTSGTSVNETSPTLIYSFVDTNLSNGRYGYKIRAYRNLPEDIEIVRRISESKSRIRSNGDILPADAFGCVGNACPDDVDTVKNGNQHSITAEFRDAKGQKLQIRDDLIFWKLLDSTGTFTLSQVKGMRINISNTDKQGASLVELSVRGSSYRKEFRLENKHPRRECVARGGSCNGGPDKGNSHFFENQILEGVVIDANNRPLNPDMFTCFGNSCVNDQEERQGNQRAYGVRLHTKSNAFFPYADVEKIEWSLKKSGQYDPVSMIQSQAVGQWGEKIFLTNTNKDGAARLTVTVTPKEGRGSPVSTSILVLNELSEFQGYSMYIKTNGQLLNADAFGCSTGDGCKEDDRVRSTPGNQHALEAVTVQDGVMKAIDSKKVYWSVSGDHGIVSLSGENNQSSGEKMFATNTMKNGTAVVVAYVDGISIPASLSIENKHPAQNCGAQGCVGYPDRTGDPAVLEYAIIDANGRPLAQDIYTCSGNSCEEDIYRHRDGNQHVYEARLHAQNNSVFPLDDVRQIQWSLSSSPSFVIVEKEESRKHRLIINNTGIFGSAKLTVTVLQKEGDIHTGEIELINREGIGLPPGAPCSTPDVCASGVCGSDGKCAAPRANNLSAPSDFIAEGETASKINLKWKDNADNETSYILDRSLDNVTFTPLATLEQGTTFYADKELKRSETYYYRVAAKNEAGMSDYATANAKTKLITVCLKFLPHPPVLSSTEALSSSEINIVWEDKSSNESSFIVERSTDGTSFVAIASPDAGKISYGDTGLSASTQYWYRVRAHNCKGDSDASVVLSATTRANDETSSTNDAIDTDNDGLSDAIEDKNKNGVVDPGETDPKNPDTDGEGLTDGQEDANKNGQQELDETNPLNSDTDGDGLSDLVDPYPLDPTKPGSAQKDTDGDGIPDTLDPNPTNPDTDGDGLLDGQEDKNKNGKVDAGETNPTDPDTDHDGLLDGQEDKNKNISVDSDETDPLNPDTDGDGLLDGVDPYPLDPTKPGKGLKDSDGDGIADSIEDKNKNGKVDKGETNPHIADSDHDGLLDGQEDKNKNGKVDKGETNPLKADSDGNGIKDGDQCTVIKTARAPHSLWSFFERIGTMALALFSAPAFAEEQTEKRVTGEFSDEAGVTLESAPSELFAPVLDGSADITKVQKATINLSWTDTSANVDHYDILRKRDSESDFVKIDAVSRSTKAYTDSINLAWGAQYDYMVRSVRGSTQSNLSNVKTITTLSAPPLPPLPLGSVRILKGGDEVIRDMFSCTGAACKQTYTVKALDTGGNDITNAIGILYSFTFTTASTDKPQASGQQPDTTSYDITPLANGNATLSVTATEGAKTVSQILSLMVDVCDYPWIAESAMLDALDLKLSYCRGNGKEDTALPNISNPVKISDRQENIDFDEEYIFPIDAQHLGKESRNKTITSDVIVLRVKKIRGTLADPPTYSPATWYRSNFGRLPSAHNPVNGYSAVQDATGVYVNAYDNVGGTAPTTGPTIYYFTTNSGASQSTREILDQLLQKVAFSQSLNYDPTPAGVNSPGAQFRRDAKRMIDIEQFMLALRRVPTLPRIDSGSFLRNQTISAWPSWQNELGRELGIAVPTDPYPSENAFCPTATTCVSACNGSDYEESRCWNPITRTFGIDPDLTTGKTAVQTAVDTNNVFAYSYHYIPPATPTSRITGVFCAKFERLFTESNEHISCRTEQRTQNNTLLSAAGASCTTKSDCRTGNCSNRFCKEISSTISPNRPPAITAITYNAANLAGAIFKKIWAPSQVVTFLIDAHDVDGEIVETTSTVGSQELSGALSPSVDIQTLPVGENTFTATVRDNFPAYTSKTAVFTVEERAPNHSPALSITAPSSGLIIRNELNINLTITATVSDEDADDGIDRVMYSLGSLVGRLDHVSGSTYSKTISLENLVDRNDYTLQVSAYDRRHPTIYGQNGLKESTVSPIGIRTNARPTFSNRSPDDGARIEHGSIIAVAGNANDSDGIASVLLYRITSTSANVMGSAGWPLDVAPTATGAFAINLTPGPAAPAVGDYTYKVVAKDRYGAENEYTRTARIVVHGGWSANWSDCSKTCRSVLTEDPGTQARTCDNPAPENGGDTCPGSSSRACDPVPPLCPINGGWSANWVSTNPPITRIVHGVTSVFRGFADGSGGLCSKKCGTGTQKKTCNNPEPNATGAWCTRENLPGVHDSGTLTGIDAGNRDEIRDCNTNPCAMNGGWSAWESAVPGSSYDDARFGSPHKCSAECNGGTQKRTCNSPAPSGGGTECPRFTDGTRTTPDNRVETGIPCNTGACPYWEWESGQEYSACITDNPINCGLVGKTYTKCHVPIWQGQSTCGTPSGFGGVSSYNDGEIFSPQDLPGAVLCNVGDCPSWGSCGLKTTQYAGEACGIGKQYCVDPYTSDTATGTCDGTAIGGTVDCELVDNPCPGAEAAYQPYDAYGTQNIAALIGCTSDCDEVGITDRHDGALSLSAAIGNVVSLFKLEKYTSATFETVELTETYTSNSSVAEPRGYYKLTATNIYGNVYYAKFSVGFTKFLTPGFKKHRDEVTSQCSFHSPPSLNGKVGATRCPFGTTGSCNQILESFGHICIPFTDTCGPEDVHYITADCSKTGRTL